MFKLYKKLNKKVYSMIVTITEMKGSAKISMIKHFTEYIGFLMASTSLLFALISKSIGLAIASVALFIVVLIVVNIMEYMCEQLKIMEK